MMIALMTAGLLIVGLIGSNEDASQQARSPDRKASVTSEIEIQLPTPPQVKPSMPAPTGAIIPTVPLHTLVTARETPQPVQQDEQQNASTKRPVTPLGHTKNRSDWVENDDNFDEWAK
jgi:hypothetical protein